MKLKISFISGEVVLRGQLSGGQLSSGGSYPGAVVRGAVVQGAVVLDPTVIDGVRLSYKYMKYGVPQGCILRIKMYRHLQLSVLC